MGHSAALGSVARSRRSALAQYIALTKPGIILLLLVTTVPTMVLAEEGMPSIWLIVATIVGGSLAAGGAGAINSYVDREADTVMRRTSHRPVPTGSVEPRQALVFGLALGAAALVWLTALVNPLTAALAVGAMAFYVVVYTVWLKPATPQNIVIGGAAGAVPPLCGWAAVTGEIGWPALVLFAIVFLWTPPHFWALALHYTDDYERARVPMLPVVRGERETKRQMMWYVVALVVTSLLLWPVAETTWLYPTAALLLGGAFIRVVWRLYRDGDGGGTMRVFSFSITYLTLLFSAVAADELIQSL